MIGACEEQLQTVARSVDDMEVLTMPVKLAIARKRPFTGVRGAVEKVYTPIQNGGHCALLNALVEASGAHQRLAGR